MCLDLWLPELNLGQVESSSTPPHPPEVFDYLDTPDSTKSKIDNYFPKLQSG